MRNSAVLQFLDPVLKRGYERGGLALRLRHFETALEDLEDETDVLLVQHLSRALPADSVREHPRRGLLKPPPSGRVVV
jgi:hypothetical protein